MGLNILLARESWDQLWSMFWRIIAYFGRDKWGGAWKILRKWCCLNRQTQLPLTPHTHKTNGHYNRGDMTHGYPRNRRHRYVLIKVVFLCMPHTVQREHIMPISLSFIASTKYLRNADISAHASRKLKLKLKLKRKHMHNAHASTTIVYVLYAECILHTHSLYMLCGAFLEMSIWCLLH